MRPGWKIWTIVLVLALAGPFMAHAAPAKPAAKLTGYPVDVQDEVTVQNLTCEDFVQFITKRVTGGYGNTMTDVAEDILDQPQHSGDDFNSLFGPSLMARIRTASVYYKDHDYSDLTGSSPPTAASPRDCVIGCLAPPIKPGDCTRIVPQTWPPDPAACRGPPNAVDDGGIFYRSGELALIGMFQRAAKLRNCKVD